MVKIISALIPLGRKNRPGYPNPCNYITIHNAGNFNKGADAKAHAGYLSNTSDVVSWHYTVDNSIAYQHLPDEETGWHAGDGTGGIGNRRSIGIEICVNPDGDLLKATDNAAELTAYLMKKHGIPLENVKQHNHWSGKNCPSELRAGRPYSWQVFLRKVESMSKNKIETAEQALEKLNSAGIVTDKAYWATALAYVKNLDYLFIKMANSI